MAEQQNKVVFARRHQDHLNDLFRAYKDAKGNIEHPKNACTFVLEDLTSNYIKELYALHDIFHDLTRDKHFNEKCP